MKLGVAACVAFALCGAAAARPLDAQRVHGVVRDSASAQPVPGAVVSLMDAAGHVNVRTIADEAGRYALTATAAVTRVQVVRIGFRPAEAALPPLDALGDVAVDITMRRIPAMLESVRVSDQTLCPGSANHGDAFTLWEQARAALLATIVAREAKPARVKMLTYQRVIYPGGTKIARQTVHAHSGVSSRPFTASRDASDFAATGYMEEGPDGRLFSAPDADVLLDESFAATHCLRVVVGDGDHRDQVGLGFDPTKGREDLVDVSGVLWIDRADPVLRTLEYHYTGLEPAAMREHAGGLLVFRAMSNGVVFIERWYIRMAALNDYMLPWQRAGTPRSDRGDLRVVEVEEAGGEVAEAAWPDGLRYQATLGNVSGRVVEADSKRPVVGARVALTDAGEFSATTDTTGRFSLSQILPGPYLMWARDTTLAQYGVVRTANAHLDVERGGTSEATLEFAPFIELVTPVCEGQRMPRGSAIYLGRVATVEGSLVSAVPVTVGWQDDSTLARRLPGVAGEAPDIPVRRTVVSDSTGHFHVCGVPRGRAVQFRATHEGATLVESTIVAGDAPYRIVSLIIPARRSP
jgi:hypothetical protein